MKKWVYLFSEGNAQMAGLLGGKGAGLCEMHKLGLPVPPGFVITTEACREYLQLGQQFPEGLWEQILVAMKELEPQSGKIFGSISNPLLVAVRSGARTSMPGMMSTVLNIGLNQVNLVGIARALGNAILAYDIYGRLIRMFGEAVLGIEKAKFQESTDSLVSERAADVNTALSGAERQITTYLSLVRQETHSEFPTDPYQQLQFAIGAVFNSWNSKSAVDFRRVNRIPDHLGTAVTVQIMVFGNAGPDSGTGVVFSRNPDTGHKEMYGEYLSGTQGEDLVSGFRTPGSIQELGVDLPQTYSELIRVCTFLERHYSQVQDIEFTIEHKKLWILQSRAVHPTSRAEVKFAVEMEQEGLISREEALNRVRPGQLSQLRNPTFSADAVEKAKADGRLLTKGINASSGVAVGEVVFDATVATEKGQLGDSVILVCQQLSPADIHGMFYAKGILTSRGGTSSHSALIARMLDRPCVTGCASIAVDSNSGAFTVGDRTIKEHDIISIDANNGEVYLGSLPMVEPELFPELRTYLTWLGSSPGYRAWANATYPTSENGIENYRTEAKAILDRVPWMTDKAKVVELLKLIPQKWRIRLEVVGARDKDKLRALMYDVLKQGLWNGPRTCYYPERLGKSPWHQGMTTQEDIEEFLSNPNYAGLSGLGGYPRWLEDPNLREIIVVYDPPEKGLPAYEDKHFVFTVSCQTNPNRIEIELNLGTTKIRSIETATPDDLVRITMFLEPERFYFEGSRAIVFGRKYIKQTELREVTSLVSAAKEFIDQRLETSRGLLGQSGQMINPQHPLEYHDEFIMTEQRLGKRVIKDICRLIYASEGFPRGGISTDEVFILSSLMKLMQTGQFTDEMYDTMVESKALKVAQTVTKTVLDEWWHPPFGLPFVMQALEETFSLQVLEVQGRYSPDGSVEYILVFDAKGREETIVADRTYEDQRLNENRK